MADIDVQQKNPTTWIWWVLGLLVLALLAFWLLSGTGRDQVAMVDQPATEPIPAGPAEPAPAAPVAAVEEYRAECAVRQPGEMALSHDHTAACIRTLAEAIEASVAQDQRTAAQAELQNARDAAQRLEQSAADALDHSQMARDGFTSIASALEQIQQQQPGLQPHVPEVNRTASAIDPNQPLLEQREQVQDFFARAGEALGSLTARI